MKEINNLLEVMAQLRDPQSGCPWDLQQDFQSIAPYTIEEAYEVADAIEREAYDELRDELGDLLLQVVFHAQMASEQGLFGFSDVAAAITAKMRRRHPHVFADAEAGSAEQQHLAWEQQKQDERRASGDEGEQVMAGIAANLPALTWASKTGKRAARVGFDWPDPEGVLAKIAEEIDELVAARRSGDEADIEEEFGDMLLAMTSLARHLQINPENALRAANRKFLERFTRMENALADEALDWSSQTPEQLETRWQAIK
jgi:ATP diphosphatase